MAAGLVAAFFAAGALSGCGFAASALMGSALIGSGFGACAQAAAERAIAAKKLMCFMDLPLVPEGMRKHILYSGSGPCLAERKVLARQGGEVEVGAEHEKRALRLASHRQSDAQLGTRNRQVGPRHLHRAWDRHGAAKVRLVLPIGTRGRPHRLQARVAGRGIVLGLNVVASLVAIGRNEVAALGARQGE